MRKLLKFRDLTALEVDVLCNGCGKKGGGIPVPEFKFTASCNQHDFNYWQGGTEADRVKADYQFYESMCVDARFKANGDKRNRFVRAYYTTLAYIYYKAVRLCGGNKKLGGFNFTDKKRGRKELDKIMEAYIANFT